MEKKVCPPPTPQDGPIPDYLISPVRRATPSPGQLPPGSTFVAEGDMERMFAIRPEASGPFAWVRWRLAPLGEERSFGALEKEKKVCPPPTRQDGPIPDYLISSVPGHPLLVSCLRDQHSWLRGTWSGCSPFAVPFAVRRSLGYVCGWRRFGKIP